MRSTDEDGDISPGLNQFRLLPAWVDLEDILPPSNHTTVFGEPLYTRDDVFRALGVLTKRAGYVSASVAAKFLNLSVRSLRDYTDRGVVPGYQIGKHRKYVLAELSEHLKQNREGKKRFKLTEGAIERVLR